MVNEFLIWPIRNGLFSMVSLIADDSIAGWDALRLSRNAGGFSRPLRQCAGRLGSLRVIVPEKGNGRSAMRDDVSVWPECVDWSSAFTLEKLNSAIMLQKC